MFPRTSEIPDDKAIFEARKRRQAMREGEAGALPLEQPISLGEGPGSRSRLVREDDNDASDEEEGGRSRFVASKNLFVDEEEKRRNEQLEALRLEQGDSDDEPENSSNDEEVDCWEREQIRKVISQKKVWFQSHGDFLFRFLKSNTRSTHSGRPSTIPPSWWRWAATCTWRRTWKWTRKAQANCPPSSRTMGRTRWATATTTCTNSSTD